MEKSRKNITKFSDYETKTKSNKTGLIYLMTKFLKLWAFLLVYFPCVFFCLFWINFLCLFGNCKSSSWFYFSFLVSFLFHNCLIIIEWIKIKHLTIRVSPLRWSKRNWNKIMLLIEWEVKKEKSVLKENWLVIKTNKRQNLNLIETIQIKKTKMSSLLFY